MRPKRQIGSAIIVSVLIERLDEEIVESPDRRYDRRGLRRNISCRIKAGCTAATSSASWAGGASPRPRIGPLGVCPGDPSDQQQGGPWCLSGAPCPLLPAPWAACRPRALFLTHAPALTWRMYPESDLSDTESERKRAAVICRSEQHRCSARVPAECTPCPLNLGTRLRSDVARPRLIASGMGDPAALNFTVPAVASSTGE